MKYVAIVSVLALGAAIVAVFGAILGWLGELLDYHRSHRGSW